MSIGYTRQFRHDPLVFMEDLRRRNPAGVFRMPWGGWCVRDVNLAWTVLRDPDCNNGMSDFFGPQLPTRAAQVNLGRAVRDVLREHMSEYGERLTDVVAGLPTASEWGYWRCPMPASERRQAAPGPAGGAAVLLLVAK